MNHILHITDCPYRTGFLGVAEKRCMGKWCHKYRSRQCTIPEAIEVNMEKAPIPKSAKSKKYGGGRAAMAAKNGEI